MASLIYVPINKFFGSINDYKELMKDKNYQLLVVSKDIITDIKKTGSSMANSYASKYKNIDFIDGIFPSPSVMEFKYGSSETAFVDAFRFQLNRAVSMEDMACIVDILINSDKNIIMLMSNAEYLMQFMDVVREFMWDMFKIKMYSYEDFVVDPGSIFDIGDIDEIRKLLQYHIDQLNLKDNITGEFMNKLYVDMAKVYYNSLSNKSVDDLVKLAASFGIYVSRHKSKDYIIDHIMKSLIPKNDIEFK